MTRKSPCTLKHNSSLAQICIHAVHVCRATGDEIGNIPLGPRLPLSGCGMGVANYSAIIACMHSFSATDEV